MQYVLKKSLGQHFLKDENISYKIISALQKHSFKRLLEIGAVALEAGTCHKCEF